MDRYQIEAIHQSAAGGAVRSVYEIVTMLMTHAFEPGARRCPAADSWIASI